MRIVRSLWAVVAALIIAAAPGTASAQVGIGIGFGGPNWGVGITAGYAPPALPVYSQPPAPYPGWQWIPGYWGWGAGGYYWTPGYWTAPPQIGYYWTPGYWDYLNGGYVWNAGYWGPTVGFYGGINYGFGYFGSGFVGGYWAGSVFRYNTAVVNVNRTVIRNTYYNRSVVDRARISHSGASFNGGRGGVHATPTRAQVAARRHAIGETAAQRTHDRLAAQDRSLRAADNHGHPRLAAVQRPLGEAHGRVSGVTGHHTTAVAAHHRTTAVAAHHQTAGVEHRGAPVTPHHNAPVLTTHHSNAMTYHNPAPAHAVPVRPQGAGMFGGHPGTSRPPGGGFAGGHRPPIRHGFR